jgi:hypothetical protein
LFFFFANLIFFSPFFFAGKIPIDANPLYQNYPWKAYDSAGYTHELNPAKHYHNIDAALSIFPLRKEVRNIVRSGDFPFWTPNIFSGTQLVGTQVAVFDILTPIFYLLPEGAGHGLVIILQFILAGWFMCLFCESLGLSRTAALLAGIAFMWNSHFMRWFGTVSYNGTLCWLPLILYSVNQFAQGKRSGFHLLVFALTAQFLGDHPQLWLYNLAAFGAYVLFQLWKLQNRIRLGIYFSTALIISMLVASPELFSVASGLRNSARGTTETAEMYAGRNFLSPRKLPTLLIPNLYGQTENNVLSKLLLKPPLEEMKDGIWERLVFGQPGSIYNRVLAYIGLIPFLFALISAKFWRESRIRFFWLLAGLPLLFLALLNFDMFNKALNFLWSGARTLDHSRLLVLCVFAFSVLAAIGFETIQSAPHRKTVASVFKIAAVFLALVFVLLSAATFAGTALQKRADEYYSQHHETFPWNENAESFYKEALSSLPSMFAETAKIFVAPLLLCSAAAILLILLARGKIAASLCMSMIVLLTFVDLLYYGRTDPTIYFSPSEAFSPKGIESLEFLEQTTPGARIIEIQKLKEFLNVPLKSYDSLDEYYTRGIRFFDFNSFEFVARPDSLLHYSIPTSSGYLGFYPARYFRLHRGRPNDILHYIKPSENLDSFGGGWIDMQGIRYILAVPGSPSKLYRTVHSSKGLTILENKNATPVVYLSSQAAVIPDATKALEHVRSIQFAPNVYTVLEEDPGLIQNVEASMTVSEKKSSTMTATVRTSGDTLLVFAENYYPGWRATIDGKRTKIFRANYTFQAVRVPAGTHVVKFSFEVVYFRLAIAFTVIGLLIWLKFFLKLA